MDSKIFAATRYSFSSGKNAQNAFKALEPEMDSGHEKRALTKASIEKNFLSATIAAEDINALKASMNSLAKSIALIKELTGG